MSGSLKVVFEHNRRRSTFAVALPAGTSTGRGVGFFGLVVANLRAWVHAEFFVPTATPVSVDGIGTVDHEMVAAPAAPTGEASDGPTEVRFENGASISGPWALTTAPACARAAIAGAADIHPDRVVRPTIIRRAGFCGLCGVTPAPTAGLVAKIPTGQAVAVCTPCATSVAVALGGSHGSVFRESKVEG